MKRQAKYYVSEYKETCIGFGWHRLTKYFLTESEARSEAQRLQVHYDNISLRTLLPNHQRKTLISY